MTKKIIIFCALFLGLTGFSSVAKASCPSPMPEGLKICADFEETGNSDEAIWGHYLERGFIQDISGKKDRFTLDSNNPFKGSFAVRSMDPNGHILNDNDTDSFFVSDFTNIFGRNTMNYGDDLFIKYAAKFPVDWEGEATDYVSDGVGVVSGGANHFRMRGGNSSGIEATFGAGWVNGGSWHFWYKTTPKWGDSIFLKDNQWHEYTIEVKMPSSLGTADGSFRVWRDNNGSYAASDAKINQENIAQAEDFNRIAVVTPGYYKGPVFARTIDGHTTSGNWTFWLDDVQIWNKMPTGVVTPPYPTCTESWACFTWSAWSTCTNSSQSHTRTCADANSCGTTTTKPALIESQSCTSVTTYNLTNFIQLTTDWLKTITASPADVN